MAVKNLEINSDKYSVLSVVILMTFMLLMLVSDVYAAANHRITLPQSSLWDYPVAVFAIYTSVILVRDGKLRRNYPYGITGMWAMSVALLMSIAFHWTKGSADARSLLLAREILGIAASSLILTEGVLWLKRRVRLV